MEEKEEIIPFGQEKKQKAEIKNNGQEGPFWFEMIKIVLLALVIIIPVRTFLFQPFFVEGDSMKPNFHDGEYLIINELGYKRTTLNLAGKNFLDVKPFKPIQRGDVIVFRYPKDPDKFFIKRVIGLPKEKVEVKKSKITIYNEQFPQGMLLDESKYLAPAVQTIGGTELFVSGEKEYVVFGDNRSESSDSRIWGKLNSDLVIGKVLLRAWPINEFDIF